MQLVRKAMETSGTDLSQEEEMSEDTDGEEEEGNREDGDDENVERIENGDK